MARHAEIAGAGFAGLVAAIALKQRGWTVRVHERADKLRAFGAGIFLWENGLRVLKAVGAYDQVIALSHTAPSYAVRGSANELIGETQFGPQLGTRMVTLTRQALYQALLDQAEKHGVDFKVSSHVVRADPSGFLATERGEVFSADVVIGADGVGSNCATSLGIDRQRHSPGFGAIRLLVPRQPRDLGELNDDDVIAFHSDGLRRALYVPCDDETLYLCLTMSADDLEGQKLPLNRDAWSQSFPHLSHLFERVRDQGRWDLFDTIISKNWTVGSAAIVGDAAHGMTPSLGQGAGCAMMNALALAEELSHADNVPDALQAWEKSERPLTDYTQNLAARLTAKGSGSLDGDLKSSESGTKWNEATMRAALHIPKGTTDPVAVLNSRTA